MTKALKKLEPGDLVQRSNTPNPSLNGKIAAEWKKTRTRPPNQVGKVISVETKRNRRGQQIKYANVLWSGQKIASPHPVNRLVLSVDSR